MAEIRLNATKRLPEGKGAARRSRAEGKVPAVVYGRGMDPLAIEVDRREFIMALRTDSGMNVLLDLQIDGSQVLTLTKELQRDPVRGTVLHADFIKIDRTQEVEVDVPIHLVGEAPGAKEGGVLEQPLFNVQVRCRATDVPESVDIDISGLAIGDSLRVADIVTPETYKILNDPEAVVAHIAAPISEEELEAMEAAVAAPVEEIPAEEVPVEEEGVPPAEGEGAPEAEVGEAEETGES